MLARRFYDAAQDRGEIRTRADNQAVSSSEKAGFADIGLAPKEIHEARQICDAETADPGICPPHPAMSGGWTTLWAVSDRMVCAECGSREVRLGPAFRD